MFPDVPDGPISMFMSTATSGSRKAMPAMMSFSMLEKATAFFPNLALTMQSILSPSCPKHAMRKSIESKEVFEEKIALVYP